MTLRKDLRNKIEPPPQSCMLSHLTIINKSQAHMLHRRTSQRQTGVNTADILPVVHLLQRI